MISVLLPSRGRPASLMRTIRMLRSKALGAHELEMLVRADDDDHATVEAAEQARARVLTGERHGYAGLHHYVNELAAAAQGEWLLLWNDDAEMRTEGWDVEVSRYDGSAVVLNPDTNHPGYRAAGGCIFPIVAAELVRRVGHFSLSAHCDSWWQEVAGPLGILVDIDVYVLHDRADLTGGHNDDTYRDREYQTTDFYSPETQRLIEADRATIRRLAA